MKRAEMARAGAEQLIVAEKAVETAFIELTKLANDLGRMRLDANLATSVGRGAMAKVVSSINMMQGVRDEMIDAHAELNEVKTLIGCRTVMVGHLDKPDEGTSGKTSGLHVVPDQRSA